MKVYTFQLPKVVSSFARFCLQMVTNDPTDSKKTTGNKKRKNDKTTG